MRKNNVLPILILVLSINFLSLGLMMLRQKGCSCNCPQIQECKKEIVEKITPAQGSVIKSSGPNEPIFLYGMIKKEEIPEELDLGDYWYWLYFAKPHLLVNNASGVPMYVDKIQLNAPQNTDIYVIDDFIDINVEVYGYQTWGYAESSVFQAEAIREY